MNENYQNIVDEVIEIRRYLHENPELPYKEFKTTKLIEKTLENWGVKFHRFKNMETGGFAEVGEGKTILYRADIDALPIKEDSCNEFCSQNEGVMHACGHDFHTAIALGLLKYFQTFPDRLNGKLRVVFQPAEEAAPGGAMFVVKENIWNNVVGILGIHVIILVSSHCQNPLPMHPQLQ